MEVKYFLEAKQTVNTTINYVLNVCNRFRGCGCSENVRTVCGIAVRPYLRFKIQRWCWVQMVLAWALTKPVAPIVT